MNLFNRFLYFFLFFCGILANSFGQSLADTILSIPTVEVRATAIRQQTAGSLTQHWSADELLKSPANRLSDLLGADAGVYIKSYGMGSLATSSIRGGSAGHTLVLWNGFPIQSPMLGLLDLALLPLSAAESVGFTPGGHSALWGSGAIGGVVRLDNRPDFSHKKSLQIGAEAGSFGLFQHQVKVGLGNRKIQSVTRLSHVQAENDFPYLPAPGRPKRQQSNARIGLQYLLQEAYWKINDRQRLAAHVWLQGAGRQIPPTRVQTRSEAFQEDLSTRVVLDYERVGAKGVWLIKSGFFEERLDFTDKQILLDSRSRFRTYLAEITTQQPAGKGHELLVGNTHQYTQAWSEGYRGHVPSLYQTAWFASWKYQGRKLGAQVSLREEMADGRLTPLVPAAGLDLYLFPRTMLKAKVSRNYRLPTLNDRYWLPGGNPDLLPESGWSQEVSVLQTVKAKGFEIQASFTVYNRTINDWILWSLRDGQSFWSANNITQVWSRGLEPRLALSHTSSHRKFALKAGYDFTRSTNQVAVENPSLAAGQQLLYTPVHRAFASLSLEWKTFYAAYQHAFTGAAQGINDPIAPFQTGNLRLQYGREFKKGRGMLFLNVLNIWNAQYLAVERRPMPGIHFQSGIQLFFYQNT